MPVFNGEPYVHLAISSVLEQSFGDFELVICDNASTDNTEAICRTAATDDGRIRYIRNRRNVGAAQNYNLCFEHSRGEFFRWMNADDLIAPSLHQRCLDALEANPEAVLAYGKTSLIDSNGDVTGRYEDNLDLHQSRSSERLREFFKNVGLTNVIYGLMRRRALERTALMGNGRIPAADIRLMVELTLLGQFIEIPDSLFYRRIHGEASSADRQDQARQTAFWRGTNNTDAFRLPAWRTHMEYLSAAMRLPDSMSERARASLFTLRRMYWSRSELASELVQLFVS